MGQPIDDIFEVFKKDSISDVIIYGNEIVSKANNESFTFGLLNIYSEDIFSIMSKLTECLFKIDKLELQSATRVYNTNKVIIGVRIANSFINIKVDILYEMPAFKTITYNGEEIRVIVKEEIGVKAC